MASELQRLVDHLGNRLGRSVAIDDPEIRLLAYSAHTGEVDEARVGSIMRRSVPSEVTSYIHEMAGPGVDDVFTVPPSPSVGLTVERVGMPIRYDDELLGYLWLLRSDGPVSDTHASALREAAGRAALIMHREYLAGKVVEARERELVRDLVSEDESVRTEATAALLEEELLVPGACTVLVATLAHEEGEPLAERDRLVLDAAIDHGRCQMSPRTALTLSRPDHSLLVAVWPGAPLEAVGAAAEELAASIQGRMAKEATSGTGWIGIGEPRRMLSGAFEAYRQGRRAAEVARVTNVLGPVVPYGRLGVYALLSQLPPGEILDAVHPGVRRLIGADPGGDALLRTLEVYLDCAGDAQRSAAQLNVHRATLYYRLHRIEALTGFDLSCGDDRLAAHLSLKLHRLIQPLGRVGVGGEDRSEASG